MNGPLHAIGTDWYVPTHTGYTSVGNLGVDSRVLALVAAQLRNTPKTHYLYPRLVVYAQDLGLCDGDATKELLKYARVL